MFENALEATVDGVKKLLGDRVNDVILCYETATAFSGTSNLWLTDRIFAYSDKDIKGIDKLCIIPVDNLENIEYDEIDGVKFTSERKTLRDLLDTFDDRDYQTVIETLAYYYDLNDTFDDIENWLSSKQLEVLEKCKQDAIEYYMED